MAATVEVLAERGYQATTADAIAQRAEVSKGLLWHYFDDLDDLLEKTARRTLDTLRVAAGAAIDLTAPAPEVIRAAVRAAVGLRRTHRAERRAIGEILLNLRAPDGRPRLGQHDLEGLYSAQEAIFRRGQAEGDLDKHLDPRLLAVTYQGAVDSMLGYLDARPDADEEHFAAMLADVLLDGMSPARPER